MTDSTTSAQPQDTLPQSPTTTTTPEPRTLEKGESPHWSQAKQRTSNDEKSTVAPMRIRSKRKKKTKKLRTIWQLISKKTFLLRKE